VGQDLVVLTRLPAGTTSQRMDDNASLAELSFEDALKQLEAIVRQLESGEVPLNESIALYAKGDVLRRQCEDRLKAAQALIEKISIGPDGVPRGTTPFAAG